MQNCEMLPRRFIRVAEAAKRYSVGMNTMYRMATNANARVKDGGLLLVDTKKIDDYLERGGELMSIRCSDLRYREIQLNDMGDVVSICIDNSNFLVKFIELVNFVKETCTEDVEEDSAVECVRRINELFGAETFEKYYYDEYEMDSDYIPTSDQILDFANYIADEIVRVKGE